jgi:hypothetical protein
MKCKIKWCTEEAHEHKVGFCVPHYQQQLLSRDRPRILRSIEDPKDYFDRIKILVDAPYDNLDQCWIWPYPVKNRRYCEFQYGGLRDKVHRWSYRLFHGDIPDGLYVLHACDRTMCYNPNHLRVGTQSDNMNDRWIRTGK